SITWIESPFCFGLSFAVAFTTATTSRAAAASATGTRIRFIYPLLLRVGRSYAPPGRDGDCALACRRRARLPRRTAVLGSRASLARRARRTATGRGLRLLRAPRALPRTGRRHCRARLSGGYGRSALRPRAGRMARRARRRRRHGMRDRDVRRARAKRRRAVSR